MQRHSQRSALCMTLTNGSANSGRRPAPLPPSAAASRDAVDAKEDTIVWHEGEETVFGYLPGRDGCFCVPRDVALPDFPLGAENPALPFGQDIVISAAMRDELQPPGS